MKYIVHKMKFKGGGFYYQFMEIHGFVFGRAYTYNDRSNTIYLDSLSVRKTLRKQGYGKKMQKVRENLGRRLGCEYSVLWVRKKSWMLKWYKRRGYSFFEKKKYDPISIWMRKNLNK